MIELHGKKYITDKEASARYGYSSSWFKLRRHEKKQPPYIRLHSKVLYDQDELDKWFITNIEKIPGSL